MTYTTDQIIEALRATNGLISLAARSLNCSPNTIYHRAKTTKAVRDVIQNARGELIDMAEARLRTMVIASDPWAVGFVLRTLGKERGYTERLEVTGEDGEPIAVRTIEVIKDYGPGAADAE